VRSFERGHCSAIEFSTGFVTEWELGISPERFLEIFLAWPVGPYPGTTELLAEVRRSVPIGCLSNTNAMHWEHQSAQWPMLAMFDHRFLSFELGLVKPDAAIFEAVGEQLAVDPHQVLYLDDVAVNAEAARRFGLRSVQVQGIDDVRQALVDVGLVKA
jgi:glucose-1-phosphatase